MNLTLKAVKKFKEIFKLNQRMIKKPIFSLISN